MNLKVVFFDMGGTIEHFHYTREFRLKNVYLLRECLKKRNIHLDITDETFVELIKNGISAYHRWNLESMIEISPARIWDEYILKDFPVTYEELEPIGDELSYIYETKLYMREMRPEIPATLESIRSLGLRIGCISNTQSKLQVPMNLKEYGIYDYFNPIVLSSEYGRRKPDPSIFYYAARLACVPTGSCVYVGDKVNRDILGANRAGFKLAVQIVHPYDDGEPDEGATPNAVIHSMEELIPILKQTLNDEKKIVNIPKDCKYKALFFDAGDILYHRPTQGKNLRKFLKGKSLHPHPNIEKEKARVKALAFEDKISRHEYYRQVIRLYGIDSVEDVAEGARAMELDDLTVEIIDGVKDTLLKLKDKGFILGIITDTALPICIKLGWFEKHGFGHIWDTVVSSREIKTRKPSPKIYQEAVHQVGLLPEESIFVGHKTTELVGARAFGMQTIAFNYDPDAPADVYIQKFSDLLELPILNHSNGQK
jgi:putative hydrolase of the HAD superfamily